MTRRAWVFVLGMMLVGTILGGHALLEDGFASMDWLALCVLVVSAALSLAYKTIFKSLKKSEAEGDISFSLILVFLSAGLFLLPADAFVLLVVIPRIFEWVKARWQKSASLRAWYIQPVNIANHICCGLLAQSTYGFLTAALSEIGALSHPAAALTALVLYAVLNHLLTGLAVVLARGSSWKSTGMLQWNTWMPDFMLLCLGFAFAALWMQNPGYSLFALSPILLIRRALAVPQLQKEAHVDAKTGLWNAAHFSRLFGAEMERATRFDRPLSVIMGDLDLLRNVNNTYGHLAGDTVLETIGEIIRESVREYDIAGRFGGEEFTICLPETAQADAFAIAERMRENIAKRPITVKTSPTPIHVTMSFGVASFPVDAKIAKELVHQADIAVYQAKLKGRNRVVAITDVPHSIRLETVANDSRLTDLHLTPSTAPPAMTSPAARPFTIKRESEPSKVTQPRIPNRHARLSLFVTAVILAGVAAAVVGLGQDYALDLGLLVVLSIVGMLAEWFQVGMYGDSTFSVSLAIVFVAIYLGGIVGLACVSFAIALGHYLKNRRIAWYKPVFNWATHVVAGLIPILTFSYFRIPLIWDNLIALAAVALLAVVGYYTVESGLISAAIGLSEGCSVGDVWRGQFDWTVLFYLALSLIGLFIALLYQQHGVLGILIFALPIALIHSAQAQYVDRTRASAREWERMHLELSSANREIIEASLQIGQLNDELLVTLAKVIDARDPLVLNHASKVAEYATTIASAMKLPSERVELIRQAALLHDIGKIGISEQILKKPSRLTGLEYELVKAHATLGGEMLGASCWLQQLAPFVRHHHEWWNGTGYPDHLTGEKIPLEARIIATADAVESMASDRPYHQAMQLLDIIAEVNRSAGTQFDPGIVDVFVPILIRDGARLVANSTIPVVLPGERSDCEIAELLVPIPNKNVAAIIAQSRLARLAVGN